MRKYLGFLKCSSIVIKVASWIFLFFGVIGSLSFFSGRVPASPRWFGFIILAFYSFMFFFFFSVAKISDIVIQIINETHKE